MGLRLSKRRVSLLLILCATLSLVVLKHEIFWVSEEVNNSLLPIIVPTTPFLPPLSSGGVSHEKHDSNEQQHPNTEQPPIRGEQRKTSVSPATLPKYHGVPYSSDAWFFQKQMDSTEIKFNYDNDMHNRADELFYKPGSGDRIIEQLLYVPKSYSEAKSRTKSILLYHGLNAWNIKSHSKTFNGCPVSRCSLTQDRTKAEKVAAILYKDSFYPPDIARRPRNQVWILYHLECPYHTSSVKAQYQHLINWTATYRRDSDIVAPYERWVYYDPNVRTKEQNIDYAANKTKKVAWFVSNCNARNERLHYAKRLNVHIPVDIYGNCGPHKCPKHDPECFNLLNNDYKFYLAFENSNCRDYITEKYFVNGLGHNILPIVMGAPPKDYLESSPEHSYIHVDDFASPRELGQYLRKLDNDNALYNAYFRWKGTGQFIDTHFWCRLCAMLHVPAAQRNNNSYKNINDWWRGWGTCTMNSWREQNVPIAKGQSHGMVRDMYMDIEGDILPMQ